MSVFKAYDIRGLVPDEMNVELARKIGHAFATLHQERNPDASSVRLLIGRDVRTHSPEIGDAVIEGMRDAGANVLDIGIASTPMTYFAIGSQDVDGGLCVTASHNPGEYNGMKLCGRGATPISKANGIADMERMCGQAYPGVTAERGSLETIDLLDAYADHVASFADLGGPITVAVDAANGMAGYTLGKVLERIPGVTMHGLFLEPDGTFPNHEANPLKEENLDPVRELVRSTGAAFGVGFDGDADRCCFVDDSGQTVSADLITALFAREFLLREPGQSVVYDLRSSWVVPEVIEESGGEPLRDRVGHSFIKATMREHESILGGELSGHFYFRDNFVCDSGLIAFVTALNLMSSEDGGGTLAERVADLRRYHSTGEINFRVPDKDAILATLKSQYASGKQDELDGVTVEFGALGDAEWWWFNVRASNTEPLLRLNLEASTAALRDAKRAELIALLGEPEA